MEIIIRRDKRGYWKLIFPKFDLPKSCAICKKRKIPFRVYKTTFFSCNLYSIIPDSLFSLNFEVIEAPFAIREFYIPLSVHHKDLSAISFDSFLRGIKSLLHFISKEKAYVLATIQRGIVTRGTFSHPQIRIFSFDNLPPNIVMDNHEYRFSSLNSLRIEERTVLESLFEELKKQIMYLTFFYNRSEVYLFLRKGRDELWPVSIFHLIGFDIEVETDEVTC